jgi:DnaK suppressor protein
VIIVLELLYSFDISTNSIKMTKISKNYRPTEKEKFMNAKMKKYFHLKLLDWKNELLKESSQTLANLQKEENTAKPDITDRASEEIERSFELRTRDRERKLINKIEAAIKKIEDGSYGYCEETGEPIGLKRLEARPVATLSLEAQEMHEKLEKKIN